MQIVYELYKFINLFLYINLYLRLIIFFLDFQPPIQFELDLDHKNSKPFPIKSEYHLTDHISILEIEMCELYNS